ncbi:metallo-beta-lactamase domain protein [Treponema socranskii subsp. socranskii VPI DR56BR1116 = ATCC 35536]|uniref:Metallo-beta-lactamase domain protein n=1 Tax=Treponema socranskii subsp. socranskii VPI DR56BR1116 = ATCC 35536 TaxID=1125725 RepID=U2LFW4_TRESO|nr:N-acyl homoserine lactonase family protein [Treponema socranskii]ERF60570.1 metallo-beta-lactamase domain protein [Treponema socranskii subsp. socranskii VPI DR56BR1116 = ATCC 35536]ERK03176.1 metallo-beta-lactamase domain protein [Treponema socranskii subsp. socranskii VPI DR56BR1116 = ATCC 35536]
MTNYTITPINTGLVNSNKATYLYHFSTHKFYDVTGDVKLPVTVFLVQGGGRKIMVDLGMSDTEIAGKYHHPGSIQSEGMAVHEQLTKLGIDPKEITDVIFTHLHWDHVYNLDKFPNADLYVQRKEYDFAVNPIPIYYKSYEYPVIGREPQFKGRAFNFLDGEAKIMDGIYVYPSPGHSVAHQTVVVNTSEGQYHCCGDLIFTYDNLKEIPQIHYEITPPGRFLNIVDEWNSIVELKRRAKSIEFILPTHAPEMLDIIASGRVYGK